MQGVKERLAYSKKSAEDEKAKAEGALKAAAEAEAALESLKKATAGKSVELNQEEASLLATIAEKKTQIAVGESNAAKLEKVLADLVKTEEEKKAVEADAAAAQSRLSNDTAELQKSLEDSRALAQSKQSAAEALRAERDSLSDELAGLKAEVEELTVSHDLEVERLQERLGQLQTVQDKLELSLSEKRREHEKALLDMDTAEEQKLQQLTESNESSMFNLKESQTMLRDAKAALAKEKKAKVDAEDAQKETKEELEEVLKESKAKEAQLQVQLTEEGTIKERLDATLAADRVQSEEAVATLRQQLADAKVALKESEKKATEFAKEYGKEFYLRKQIAEQLQEMTGGMRVFCRVRPLPVVMSTPEEGEDLPPSPRSSCRRARRA